MTCMDQWLTGDMLMHILENHLKFSNFSWLCVKTLRDMAVQIMGSLLSKTWLEFLPVATGWATGLVADFCATFVEAISSMPTTVTKSLDHIELTCKTSHPCLTESIDGIWLPVRQYLTNRAM